MIYKAIKDKEPMTFVRGVSTLHDTIHPIVTTLLNSLEVRLALIRYHSEAVASLSVSLAKVLGWKGEDLEMLEVAALLHDVGKIALPDAILRKSQALSPSDWDIIRLHPYFSVYILEPLEVFEKIVPWIYHHHENWDGTGYPSGLKGDDIPMAARFISIADAFHAMTTERIYHEALSVEDALAEIRRCTGERFDPEIAGVFIEVIKSLVLVGGRD